MKVLITNLKTKLKKKLAVFCFQLLKNVFFHLNFVIKVRYNRVLVGYNQEGSVFDWPKPNQAFNFVPYKREFAITEFVITEFHCIRFNVLKLWRRVSDWLLLLRQILIFWDKVLIAEKNINM